MCDGDPFGLGVPLEHSFRPEAPQKGGRLEDGDGVLLGAQPTTHLQRQSHDKGGRGI